jgi:hypothetical protein
LSFFLSPAEDFNNLVSLPEFKLQLTNPFSRETGLIPAEYLQIQTADLFRPGKSFKLKQMKQKILRANLFIGLGLIIFSAVLLAIAVPFTKHWF